MRYKTKGQNGNNLLVLDRINQLSIDNKRPEPMPRQRHNNNNNNNEQPMGSRPNSRQQMRNAQLLKPLSTSQQQQQRQNGDNEQMRSTMRRHRVQSNGAGSGGDDLIGGNDISDSADNAAMFSYVIDHFKPTNNNR